MQAKAILDAAAETYTGLKSLAADILSIQESDDDGGTSRSEQRHQAAFVAPAKFRLEHAGRHGTLTVSDGIDLHYFFKRHRHYRKQPVAGGDTLSGLFRPEFPSPNGPVFLFNRIAENVVRAEFEGEEPASPDGQAMCQVVKVHYGSEEHHGFPITFSPMTFWVDARTRLILRAAGEMTHRIPPDHEETRTSRHTLVFSNYRVDEAIPPEIFQFTPPADSVDDSEPGVTWGPRGRMGGSMTSFSSGHGPDDGHRVENWSSHEWSGDTLVEHSKWKFRGIELVFERRLTLSEDGKQLSIGERVTGPKGDTERELSIPVE